MALKSTRPIGSMLLLGPSDRADCQRVTEVSAGVESLFWDIGFLGEEEAALLPVEAMGATWLQRALQTRSQS